MHYTCKKLFPDFISEFDPKSTVDLIAEEAIRLRKQESISKNDARTIVNAYRDG